MYAEKIQDKVHKQKCFKISQKWAVCFVKIVIVYKSKLSCVPLVKLAEVVQIYSISKSNNKKKRQHTNKSLTSHSKFSQAYKSANLLHMRLAVYIFIEFECLTGYSYSNKPIE